MCKNKLINRFQEICHKPLPPLIIQVTSGIHSVLYLTAEHALLIIYISNNKPVVQNYRNIRKTSITAIRYGNKFDSTDLRYVIKSISGDRKAAEIWLTNDKLYARGITIDTLFVHISEQVSGKQIRIMVTVRDPDKSYYIEDPDVYPNWS